MSDQARSLDPKIMSLRNQRLGSAAYRPEHLALVLGTEAEQNLTFCSTAIAMVPPLIKAVAVLPVLLLVTVAVVIIVTKRYLIAGGKS